MEGKNCTEESKRRTEKTAKRVLQNLDFYQINYPAKKLG
jgi:hypothetical protein